MRLGINAVRLSRPFTGVGRALECVLDEWSRMDFLPFSTVTLFSPAPIDPRTVTFPLDRFEVVVGGPKGPDPWWEARFLAPRAADIDVLYAPSYTLPLGYSGRSVVFYHGPAETRPISLEWCRDAAYDRLYRYSARHASHVIACSETVKRRVVEVFGVPAARVSVALLAPSRFFVPVTDAASLKAARERFVGSSDAPFVLFVGKLSRRHSIPELIAAFGRVHETIAPRHRLVLAGPLAIPVDVQRLAREAGVAGLVVHHAFVRHEDLPALYSAAEEVVFPATEAEGFGLPVIEAMACGTPVVSVAQGSVPEVAGGAAHLVPSSRVDDLADGLARVIPDRALRERLAAGGLERARRLTWRATAETILGALTKVAR